MQYFNAVDFMTTSMRLDLHLDKFEKLNALKTKVETNKNIAAWIAKRPN